MDNRIQEYSEDCVGCGNCANTCPKDAIKMQYDNYGFLSPIVDKSECINCGSCISVCQINNINLVHRFKQYGYIAISKNKKLYRNAASGGAFSTIATSFFSKFPNGYVVGAAFVGGKVSHIIIKNKNEIVKLQNSKYVQSDMNSIASDVKKLLDKNNTVLFSGTPCQVYALKLFLKKKYENLFTIDLVCHGVPSPLFLKSDLKQYGSNIESLHFRHKKPFKSKSGFILSFSLNGKRKYYLSNRDLYYALFMKNLSFRKQCYKCNFANLNRSGDITIGDCDSYKEYPSFHINEATSLVIINSLKGEYLWNASKQLFDFSFLDIIKEAKLNSQLTCPSPEPDEWVKIMNNIKIGNFNELTKKYAKSDNFKAKLLLLKNLFLP